MALVQLSLPPGFEWTSGAGAASKCGWRFRLITVSGLAANEIRQVLGDPKQAGKIIRIRVTKGGCAGYNYDVVLDNKLGDEDYVYEGGDFRVVSDAYATALIEGSELDFNDELIGRGFLLRNPNAEITCGCGTSFNVKPRRSPMKYMREKKEDVPRPLPT